MGLLSVTGGVFREPGQESQGQHDYSAQRFMRRSGRDASSRTRKQHRARRCNPVGTYSRTYPEEGDDDGGGAAQSFSYPASLPKNTANRTTPSTPRSIPSPVKPRHSNKSLNLNDDRAVLPILHPEGKIRKSVNPATEGSLRRLPANLPDVRRVGACTVPGLITNNDMVSYLEEL